MPCDVITLESAGPKTIYSKTVISYLINIGASLPIFLDLSVGSQPIGITLADVKFCLLSSEKVFSSSKIRLKVCSFPMAYFSMPIDRKSVV